MNENFNDMGVSENRMANFKRKQLTLLVNILKRAHYTYSRYYKIYMYIKNVINKTPITDVIKEKDLGERKDTHEAVTFVQKRARDEQTGRIKTNENKTKPKLCSS